MTQVAVYHQKEKNTFSIKIYYPTLNFLQLSN